MKEQNLILSTGLMKQIEEQAVLVPPVSKLKLEDLSNVWSQWLPPSKANVIYGGSTLWDYNWEWDLFVPKYILLYGVKVLSYSGTYEAILFDDISKYNTFERILLEPNSNKRRVHNAHINNFTIVSDTCIRFTIDNYFDPSKFSFKLEAKCK